MKLKNALGIVITVVLVINRFFSYPVLAQEFSVTGNGEGSSNSISFQVENNNQVDQTNTADIENEVEVEAQTGSNEANANTGEVEIETGDVTENVVIVNSGNSSTVQVGCCEEKDPSSAAIENNGASSDNSIDVSDNSSTVVNIVNELTIQNNVDISANTGDNEAFR